MKFAFLQTRKSNLTKKKKKKQTVNELKNLKIFENKSFRLFVISASKAFASTLAFKIALAFKFGF